MRVTESFDKTLLNYRDYTGLRYLSRIFSMKFRTVQCAGSLGLHVQRYSSFHFVL